MTVVAELHAETDNLNLREWHCQNPKCGARLRGRPRVVLVGDYAPGTMAQSLPCPVCGWRTVVIVRWDGAVEYHLKRR